MHTALPAVSASLLSLALSVQAPGAFAAPSDVARLRWLADLGAESISVPQAQGPPSVAVVSVPGAAYVLAWQEGQWRRRQRLAADSASPYGVATRGSTFAIADRQGGISLWTASASGTPSLQWRRETGDRVTSVGLGSAAGPAGKSDDLVLVATWKGQLLALAAADGRPRWTAEIGGRAEAPPVLDGADVFVATKARTLVRLSASTGLVRWKAALPGIAVHPPALVEAKPAAPPPNGVARANPARLVVCGTLDGQLVAVDAGTGRPGWNVALGARLASAPVLHAGIVAAVTADGSVHAYNPGGELAWVAPEAARGPASLIPHNSADGAPVLLSVSRVLVDLRATDGQRLGSYPDGAVEELRQRFADAMLEGIKTYSEPEKRSALDAEAFEVAGPLFGPARVVGSHLAFGTEEGWAHLFDVTRLRPLARYRAGQACAGPPRLAAGHVVGVAGEELHALDALTGSAGWKRIVGAGASGLVGETTLAVAAGGRMHAVAAGDGGLLWSLRGSFRAVASLGSGAPPEAPWLAEDGGELRALQAPGRVVGEPIPTGGEVVALRALDARSWAVATREGRVFVVAWETGDPVSPEGRLAEVAAAQRSEPIVEMHVIGGRLLVRSRSGAVASLDPVLLDERFRTVLAPEDRLQPLPEAGLVAVLGSAELRLLDALTGEVRFRQATPCPAVAVDVRGGGLSWLDRQGGAHRVSLGDGASAHAELGVALSEAVPVPEGFVVTTAAGELGFVEVAAGAAAQTVNR